MYNERDAVVIVQDLAVKNFFHLILFEHLNLLKLHYMSFCIHDRAQKNQVQQLSQNVILFCLESTQ